VASSAPKKVFLVYFKLLGQVTRIPEAVTRLSHLAIHSVHGIWTHSSGVITFDDMFLHTTLWINKSWSTLLSIMIIFLFRFHTWGFEKYCRFTSNLFLSDGYNNQSLIADVFYRLHLLRKLELDPDLSWRLLLTKINGDYVASNGTIIALQRLGRTEWSRWNRAIR